MDFPPSRADQLFEMIGVPISKFKKSTVLKATEICDKLFAELEEDNLLIPSGTGKKSGPKNIEFQIIEGGVRGAYQ